MITSSIPGRFRVRHPDLRRAGSAKETERKLGALAGVKSAAHNECVGSLLVTFDPAVATEEKILQALALSGQPAIADSPAPDPRRLWRAGLILSLAVAAGAALLRLKTVHAVAGVALLVFAAQHIWGSAEPPDDLREDETTC